MRQRIAAKAVIEGPEGKVLIVREAPATYGESTTGGSYTFPGGRIDPGERYMDGLRREIREETGLEIAVGGPVFVEEWFPTIKGEPHQIIAIYFQCRALGNKVRLSHEHDDFQWVDAAEIKTLKVKGPDGAKVSEWLENRQKP